MATFTISSPSAALKRMVSLQNKFPLELYTVRIKKNATICKICVPLFDKKRSCFALHFYGLPLDLCGRRRNTRLRHFLPNASQFGTFYAYASNMPLFHRASGLCTAKKTGHFRGLRRTFGNCGALVGSAQLWRGHRCEAHTIKGSAGHVTQRVQGPLRRICCVLFDV